MPENTISLSAWVVVACQLLLKRSKRWQSLPAENTDFYKRCSEYCRKHSRLCRLLGSLPDAFQLWLLERLLAKGAAQHFVLRKQAIARQVESSIDQGIQQIVVIGGGFDPLALHMARRHPAIHCFEIDTPGMHTHKMAIARAVYDTLPPNFHALGTDLSKASLYDTLTRQTAFRIHQPALFIAEGVTMYLRQSDILRLFSDIRQLSNAATIAFTAIEISPSKRWGGQLRDILLSSNNERFSWGVPQKDMPAFLATQGFSQQHSIAYAELQQPWRSEKESALLLRQSGEYLVYAVAQSPNIDRIAAS